MGRCRLEVVRGRRTWGDVAWKSWEVGGRGQTLSGSRGRSADVDRRRLEVGGRGEMSRGSRGRSMDVGDVVWKSWEVGGRDWM